MKPKKVLNRLNGWVNLDKPAGITSTDAVTKLKWLLKPEKIGHAGTLDPLATGILPIALGEATKAIPYLMDTLKLYNFAVTWGEERTTDDSEGFVTNTSPIRPDLSQIQKCLPRYTGQISQTPPQFSAIKIDGARAYDMAREGQIVEIKPRLIYIERLEIVSHNSATTCFQALCGKGTYIRSLARDIGRDLGCFGYISALRRASVGSFDERNSISLDKLAEIVENLGPEAPLLPLLTALDGIPALAVSEAEMRQIRNGQPLTLISRSDLDRLLKAGLDPDVTNETVAVITFNKSPLGLVSVTGPGIRVLRLFNL